MSSKRLHLLFIGLLVLLGLALVGGAYGVNSLLVQESDKAVSQKAKVAALQKEQQNLILAKKDIAGYADLYNITKAIVPESKDQAEIVRQIVNIAAKNNVSIGSITFPASTLGSTGTKLAAPGSSTTAPAAVVGKPLSATGSDGKLNLSQLLKVPNIPGVYILQTQITEDSKNPVTYQQLIGFLKDIEQNRLTAEVTNINITPSQDFAYSRFLFELTINSYIKP